MCSKGAQGQREKSLMLSRGGIRTQIYTETFPHILTNIDGGKKDTARGKVRSKDTACLRREQFASCRSHTNRRNLTLRAEVTVVGHPTFHGKATLAAVSVSIPSGAAAGSPNP